MISRFVAPAVVVLVFTLALAACGGTTKAAAPPTTTTPTTTGRGARLAAYTSCLKSHLPAGTTLPTRGFFGGGRAGGTAGAVPSGSVPTTTLPAGVTSAQWQTALADCRSQLPTGGAGARLNSPAFAAYRNCLNAYLSANGGQPLSTGAGGFGGFGGTTATTTPLMGAAVAHCAALRPTASTTSTTA